MRIKFISIILALTLIMTAAPAAFADDTVANNEEVENNTTVEEPAVDNSEESNATLPNEEATTTDATESVNTNVEPVKKEATKTTIKTIKLSVVAKAKATGKGSIKVSWTKISGSKGYKVYRSINKNSKYKKVYTTKKTNKISWTDKTRTLKRNKTYFYKVVPNNKRALVKKKAVKTTEAATVSSVGAAKADYVKAKVKNVIKGKRNFKVKTTAYSGGGLCANGKRCKVGRVAVDPRVIPLGTWLYIDGYGVAQACDTGGAIKGKKIDLYFNGGESKCGGYGVRTTRVFVL